MLLQPHLFTMRNIIYMYIYIYIYTQNITYGHIYNISIYIYIYIYIYMLYIYMGNPYLPRLLTCHGQAPEVKQRRACTHCVSASSVLPCCSQGDVSERPRKIPGQGRLEGISYSIRWFVAKTCPPLLIYLGTPNCPLDGPPEKHMPRLGALSP